MRFFYLLSALGYAATAVVFEQSNRWVGAGLCILGAVFMMYQALTPLPKADKIEE